MFRRLLIAFDGSPGADRALQAALSIAKEYGAELHVVAVEEGLPRYAATSDEMDAVKEQKDAYYERLSVHAEAEAARAGVGITPHVLPGQPTRVIPDLARRLGCDLIITGFHGHSALHDRLLGSTSSGVISHSDCPVMVVR
jgi:nucleotide-binding universal stress UspA family protein